MLSKKIKTGAIALLALAPGLLAFAPAANAQSRYQAALVGNHAMGAVTPSPLDTTSTTGAAPSGDPDYTDTFAGVQSEVTGAISGPGKLAIGVMILGVVFSVVWRLVRRAGKSIA